MTSVAAEKLAAMFEAADRSELARDVGLVVLQEAVATSARPPTSIETQPERFAPITPGCTGAVPPGLDIWAPVLADPKDR